MAGGGKANTSPSLMFAVFMKSSPTSCGVVTVRSSQCVCVTKMVAALLRKPPPRKSKPVKATTSWLTGLDLIAASTSPTTLSVRSSVAPSGSTTAAM
jgi:hypothetical protein